MRRIYWCPRRYCLSRRRASYGCAASQTAGGRTAVHGLWRGRRRPGFEVAGPAVESDCCVSSLPSPLARGATGPSPIITLLASVAQVLALQNRARLSVAGLCRLQGYCKHAWQLCHTSSSARKVMGRRRAGSGGGGGKAKSAPRRATNITAPSAYSVDILRHRREHCSIAWQRGSPAAELSSRGRGGAEQHRTHRLIEQHTRLTIPTTQAPPRRSRAARAPARRP